MKKSILLIAISLFSVITFAQTTKNLKITSSIPTDQGMKSNVSVKFDEFYLNKSLGSQFNVSTFINDTVPVIAYIPQVAYSNITVKVGIVYMFQLTAIPDINVRWDSVKVRLEKQGLTGVKVN